MSVSQSVSHSQFSKSWKIISNQLNQVKKVREMSGKVKGKVREKSGKNQGISFRSKGGHPENVFQNESIDFEKFFPLKIFSGT